MVVLVGSEKPTLDEGNNEALVGILCVCVCPVKMQKGRREGGREGGREVGMTSVSHCERGAKEVRGCNPRRCHATQTDAFEWVERYLSVFYALLLLLLLLLLLCCSSFCVLLV
jgi:hypothetical protein